MPSPYLESALHTVFDASLNGAFDGLSGADALSSFLNGLSIGALLTNATSGAKGPRIFFANRAMAELCGYSKVELVGGTPKMLHGEKTSRAVAEGFRKTLETVGRASMRIVNYDANGAPYIAHVLGSKLDVPSRAENDLRIALMMREDQTQQYWS